MRLQRIHAENYKTYRTLDLDLTVEDDRPIILVGGANGCGKTTLFDAIYGALYGLDIKDPRQFEELYNAGAKNESGIGDNSSITLEISFTGNVLGTAIPYKLKRRYVLYDGLVRESVELDMGGDRFVYGSAMTPNQRKVGEEQVNKIIAANLPRELSNYFLFDAMKTSDLVKEEQINKLILKNINSVMGFNKYAQLRKASDALLAEKKAARLANEEQRKEFESLQAERTKQQTELQKLQDDYATALQYASANKTMYEQIKAGRNEDDITRDKIAKIKQNLQDFARKENDYHRDMDVLVKELEIKVLYPKLADTIRAEVQTIIQAREKVRIEESKRLTTEQIEQITDDIVNFISRRYLTGQTIDTEEVVRHICSKSNHGTTTQDEYAYFSDDDIEVLSSLIRSAYVNPFIVLDDMRSQINAEMASLPQRQKELADYEQVLGGADYTLIEVYEANEQRIKDLKQKIEETKKTIGNLENQLSTYDYDIPPVPDPQYDMLCKLPDFFKSLSDRLLSAKKANIERMLCEQLNLNLVIYAGYIGRVELSGKNPEDISFKMYHKNGNEIYLSQLNAGAKQTVMQVLLKVLYELGDYDPPVMIDTVMGVLDKESREVILEQYFPDLAHQTILLSTDTEITTEHDFKKIEAFVSKVYTLQRDKENQCTTISDNYFGLTL